MKMQAASMRSLLWLAALSSTSSASFGTSRTSLSPVTRCVTLLRDLYKQIEKESKTEEELFEKYMCWGKTVVATKTASTSAAESRVDMLKAYIADIDAGRVEFTSERQDLVTEIDDLGADIKQATDIRHQEHKDFLEAKTELDQGINALTSAITVLETATKDHKTGVLFALKSSVNEGFAARAAEGASLRHAADLGEKFLTKGDSVFLRRLLTGEVPQWNWRKLNRKATFKSSYKARSFKIQDVLNKLKASFQANLLRIESKEKKTQILHDALMNSKTAQLTKAQAALGKMEKEMGARGMTKANAEEEVTALELQVKNDKQFVADTEASMVTKTKEWKERSKLRAGELKAISEAVAILNSDDAKDNFKKSFSSQGFLFLQVSKLRQHASRSTIVARASEQIQNLARVVNDNRLVELVGNVTAGTHFDEVIKAIDKMVTILQNETANDLIKKQDCESTRMSDTRDVIVAGRAIDDMTNTITSLTSDIQELSKTVAETKEDLAKATEEINVAKKIRDDENAEWKTSDADDKEASETVVLAKQTLEKFYRDNGLVLVQKQPQAAAGEAPLPPPPTWEGSYKGKVGETNGILSILKLVQEDIDKDRASAKAEEDKAQAAYDKAYKAFKAQEKLWLKAISDLEGKIGDKEKKVETTEKDRLTKKGDLDATLSKIKGADPGCNYIEVNYVLRVKNRAIEIDGLIKAKAILQGAAFSQPADPTRELKPGDALLQRLRRH